MSHTLSGENQRQFVSSYVAVIFAIICQLDKLYILYKVSYVLISKLSLTNLKAEDV